MLENILLEHVHEVIWFFYLLKIRTMLLLASRRAHISVLPGDGGKGIFLVRKRGVLAIQIVDLHS